jgi:hypothetical protein
MCLQAIEAELLIHDIYYGFRVLPETQPNESVTPFEVGNYPTTEECAQALQNTLDAECKAGILRRVEEKPKYLTALNAKVEKDKIRTLCDYSAPDGKSINAHADARHFSMMSHEDAYALMRPNYYMAKVDIKSAFRTVGVHPSHWPLLGYQWTRRGKPEYYLDTRFPFGLKCSPEIFCRLSHAVRAMMVARGYNAVVVYVDDFWLIAPTYEECEEAKQALVALLRALGFTLSEHKIEGPTQAITFLGLLLSTNCDNNGGMRVTVPPDKLLEAERRARTLVGQRTVPVKQLQSAVGYFQHIANAIYPARAFLRRLIHAITTAEAKNQHTVNITRAIELDLNFWANDAPKYNGTAVLLAQPQLADGFLATDASSTRGMGGFYDGAHFSVAWDQLQTAQLPKSTRKRNNKKLWPQPDCPMSSHINYKEMFAIWWALLQWGGQWRNKCVTLHCDNDTARSCFNKLRAHSNIAMMRLLRHAAKFMADYNIRLRIVRISSEANVLADALSRLDNARFEEALRQWTLHRLHEYHAPPWEQRVPRDPPLMEQKAREYKPDAQLAPPSDDAEGAESSDSDDDTVRHHHPGSRNEQPRPGPQDAKRRKTSF